MVRTNSTLSWCSPTKDFAPLENRREQDQRKAVKVSECVIDQGRTLTCIFLISTSVQAHMDTS
jgi:hypothetical protein